MIEKRTWFYDLETLNVFTATFRSKNENEKRVFVISKERDDRKEMFDFLNNEVSGLIGFNCIHFDAQILEYMYRYPNCTVDNIRGYARIITENNDRRPDVPEWNLRIKHLDLFRALGLSTKAKRTGLKWCEFMLDFENIEDMPMQGEGDNWIDMVLSYNDNDVLATKKLYETYKHEIELRKTLTEREKVNLLNSTEPDMAKKLFSKYLSKAMKISEKDLRSMSTKRDIVSVKDILLPYIQSEKYNYLIQEFKKLNIVDKRLNIEQIENTDEELSSGFKYSVMFQNVELVFGLGGIHGSVQKRIVEPNENETIMSCDVTSMYPNLMIKNGLCPAHLPKDIFLSLYNGWFIERKSIPKKDPKNYILKILLNAAYGLTNDEYSFLRDRAVTLAICINGQLSILMLIEMLSVIPNMKLVMANTDGIEVIIEKQYEDLYFQICKEWEELTKLSLEYARYKKMIIRDVNVSVLTL